MVIAVVLATSFAIHCGGTRASWEMTMGLMTPRGQKPQVRSLEALAAIAQKKDAAHIVGWLAVDDRASLWIQFNAKGAALKRELGNEVVDFSSSGSLFSPLRDSFVLPPAYELEACISTIGGGP